MVEEALLIGGSVLIMIIGVLVWMVVTQR